MKLLSLLAFIFIPTWLAAQVTLTDAFPALSFSTPVEMLTSPGDSKKVYIVQQDGKIKVFPNKQSVAVSEVKTFLDISSQVLNSGEQGLLGFTFHPSFNSNRYIFVSYIKPGPVSVISRFTVKTSNPDEVDPTSEFVLLNQTQPYPNHKGGKLLFGSDGYLYISFGDGGSGGDPNNYGQNLSILLGKILRIDVNQPSGPLNYSIPPDNPFINTPSIKPEIYAYGLRNVWKFSFDKLNGTLWAADVGQNTYEEIDIISKGGNYGWRMMEGTHCYDPATNCNPSGNFIFPMFDYSHSNGDASVTGGYVYRGIQIPQWYGVYVYGDFISGRIWTLKFPGGTPDNELFASTGGNISSFCEDHRGELYLLIYYTGKIFRFMPSLPAIPSGLIVSKTAAQFPNTLFWTDNANNETGYVIQRQALGGSGFVSIDTTKANFNSYYDATGDAASNFTYRIKAINDAGSSEFIFVGNVVVSAVKETTDAILVWPIPASNVIQLKGGAVEHVQLTSLTGIQMPLTVTERSNGAAIDVSQLANAVYILSFKRNGTIQYRKVVVMH